MAIQVAYEVRRGSKFVLPFLLGVLTVNSLIANWNLNLVWDLFFARIYGPIFYGAHATSVLCVCFMAIGLRIWRYKSNTIPILALFGTAALHEFGLVLVAYLWDGFLRGEWLTFNGDGISWNYAAWLGFFIGLGLWKLGDYELRMWALIFGTVFAWYMVAMISPWPSTMNAAYFYNLGSNISESVSWFLPVSLWSLPKRWLNANHIEESRK